MNNYEQFLLDLHHAKLKWLAIKDGDINAVWDNTTQNKINALPRLESSEISQWMMLVRMEPIVLHCITNNRHKKHNKPTCMKKKGATAQFTQREIRQALNQSKTTCFRYFEELMKLEYIAVADGSANRGYVYKVTEWKPMQELKDKIKKGLYVLIRNYLFILSPKEKYF